MIQYYVTSLQALLDLLWVLFHDLKNTDIDIKIIEIRALSFNSRDENVLCGGNFVFLNFGRVWLE